MAKTAEVLISQAKSWIGCKESDGSHKKIIDVYNSHKPLARGYKMQYTDAWCSTFVSACAIATDMTDIIPTECGCEKHIELFKKLGCWIEDESIEPKPGYIIFYDWQDSGEGDNKGYSDHVGIVEKVANGKLTIIEGNYQDSVKRRVLSSNGKYIRGYANPAYADAFSENKKSIDVVAQEVIAGEWGNDPKRSEELSKAGYDAKAVQAKVNELIDASKESAESKTVGTVKPKAEEVKTVEPVAPVESPKEEPKSEDASSLRTIKKGCKGDDVKQLQHNLNVVMNARLDEDGSCGPLTDKAIRNFQKQFGLEVDGKFGPASRAKMAEVINQPSTTTKSESNQFPYAVKIICTKGMNLRSGAGMNYSIVGSVNYKAVVTVYAQSGNWGKVSRNQNKWLNLADKYVERV